MGKTIKKCNDYPIKGVRQRVNYWRKCKNSVMLKI
nr:MAG TPA: hypothetical protein [Caudoviricetes sp.]